MHINAELHGGGVFCVDHWDLRKKNNLLKIGSIHEVYESEGSVRKII